MNHVLDEGSNHHMQRGNFDRKKVICMGNGCLKEQDHNNSSTTASKLQRNAGPSAFQLQETMLKSGKIWCRYLVINCVRL